ncbi:MAG TPA: flagellar basal body P-ring protein FlgI [Candidatus Desulfofervidus auxilii]|uniref:Flagellar P-ring protein n=1 Tax=Desulfofervidus auxilii TaxID=1621989 RepID=A0A7C2ALE7_DESA2|nr:flagellar basal body P-ring protein FlgI [Candidatus Desulfofervidus auxilii]
MFGHFRTKGKRHLYVIFIFYSLFSILLSTNSFAVRIKDIASIQGVRPNQLIGYGLVTGLNGTGDKTDQIKFIAQSVANMLRNMGINVPFKDVSKIRLKNVAAVMVTANIPPFAKIGTTIDVLVSSIGDAKSLQGGTLALTPLKGADGKVYALAQGPISIGGFGATGAAGGGIQKNHITVGRIVNGAIIERQIPFDIARKQQLNITLDICDFTTILRICDTINHRFGEYIARPVDGRTIDLHIPDSYKNNPVKFIALVENISVEPDTIAKVIINERTGTVVIGEDVKISTVAVTHGNLTIEIKEQKQVYPAYPFAPEPPPETKGAVIPPEKGMVTVPGGQTVIVPETEIKIEEEKKPLAILPKTATIGELVRALNAIGVTPRDLISILQAIKSAGALHAELEII